jgi:CHASE1-domain containing sensor protein
MDLIKGKQLLIATFLYLLLSFFISMMIQPFSMVNFLGPAAGIASAFTLIWGAGVLFSIIIGTISFSVILLFINGEAIDVSILLIAILAISFQALWTKELIRHLIAEQRWLVSRTLLFGFLFKIGPLAAVVSASATVIITMLDGQMFGMSMGMAFFTSWVASVLSALFFVPSVLLIHGAQRLSVAKRFVVIFSSTLGFTVIGLLFWLLQSTEQHQRVDDLDKSVALLQMRINDEGKAVDEDLRSFTALFKASDYVSIEAFTTFATHIYNDNQRIRALEWIPLIADESREHFESSASEALGLPFIIKEQLDNGQIRASATKASYLPIYYIYPYDNNKQALGLDLLNHPDKKKTMEQAASLNTAVASPPLTLVQDDQSNSGTWVFYPVFNKPSLMPYAASASKKQQSLTGYVSTVVQFDKIFNDIEGMEKLNNIQVMIQDVTTKMPILLYGNQMEGKGRLSKSFTFNAFARKYLINISEAQSWINQDKDWKIWTVLAGAILGSFVFQLLILMMAAYTVQLSHQVLLTTEKLIRSKEDAEQKNRAKSHFLKTLGNELKAPINALDYFVEKFHQNPTFDQAEHSMRDIGHASDNLTQLIDTLVDLNEIETGKNNVLQLSVFDFHYFLQKIETLLPANNKESKVKFTFIIDDKVPKLIESDELRLQRLLLALAQNAPSLLNYTDIRVSVKAHIHQLKRTTLFFVLTPLIKLESTHDLEQKQQAFIDHDLGGYSTSMTMVKELCQLFDGDINLNQSASGQVLLSASIKVNLSTDDSLLTENQSEN